MDKLKTISVGGFPLVLDDLRWFFGRLGSPNEGIYQAFNNILRGFGDNQILQGVVVSGVTPNVAITEGWVILDGELLKVDADSGINTTTDNTFIKDPTSPFDSRGNKEFLNGSTAGTYEKNRAVVQGTVGNLALTKNRTFNTWSDFILTNSDIKAEDGSGMTLDPGAGDDNKRIRFLVTGNMVQCSIRIIGANASNTPLQGFIIKLPPGIIASKIFEGSGNYQNTLLGSEPANETKNTGIRILTKFSVFFTTLGDSLLIRPQRDGFDKFNTNGANNLEITGEIFFEIE